jgi:hypothetical protein
MRMFVYITVCVGVAALLMAVVEEVLIILRMEDLIEGRTVEATDERRVTRAHWEGENIDLFIKQVVGPSNHFSLTDYSRKVRMYIDNKN